MDLAEQAIKAAFCNIDRDSLAWIAYGAALLRDYRLLEALEHARPSDASVFRGARTLAEKMLRNVEEGEKA